MHMNKQLEMCITELRLERKGVLGKKRRADEQEKLMTGEMRGFSATAHSALDEKEKLKGKERRLRHEWEIESAAHTATLTKLHEEDEWLGTSIAHLDGREEEAQQLAKGEEYVEARAQRSAAERRASRLGYLASQCLGMQREFDSLLAEAARNNRGEGDADYPGDAVAAIAAAAAAAPTPTAAAVDPLVG
eukprot:scaffold137143_cov39-Phaeocystis_antarctica.AAC.1